MNDARQEAQEARSVEEEFGPGTAATGPLRPMADSTQNMHASTENEDMLDWEVKIQNAPARRSELLLARFVEKGRRPIVIPDDPRD